MVKVYYQDVKGVTSDLVAAFVDEDVYNACADALEDDAELHRCTVVVSIDEEDLNFKIE